MKNIAFVLLAMMLVACQKENPIITSLYSPDGAIKVETGVLDNGKAFYLVKKKERIIIDTSTLGFDFLDVGPLSENLKILRTAQDSLEETWQTVWGEQKNISNKYNELTVTFAESLAPKRQFDLQFRVYDDGLGFRYVFPEQQNMDTVTIMDENTQFNLTGNHLTWWIPGDWDIYEHLYNTTLFSEIDAIAKRNHPNLAQTTIPENAVNTPVTMKTEAGEYLSFHEANLSDYSGMTLRVNVEDLAWESELVGSRAGHKAIVKTPFRTPWRTIQITDSAADLIASNLIVNLNEPNKLNDTDWIQPMKYVGIWWGMHLGKYSWDKGTGKHGATTENTKKYIDFAAAHNIKGVLVEGWNTGWEVWFDLQKREEAFDFVTPYEDYDIRAVVEYAASKGVEMIGHHETSASVLQYEKQLDTAFALLESLGINAVKTGYVGKIIPEGEYHHGQFMVNHYRKVLTRAAEHKIMIDAHEPIKATGIRRTYPNMVSREGLRGQEFNAWSDDMNPPEHTVIVPFTRMLAGPIDFTPGIFDLKFDQYKEKNQVNTTLAKQLALYVTMYSPVQMAADLPENYEGQPAFKFIEEVAVDWDTTVILNAEIGDYLTIARKERNGDRWFLGGITDEYSRNFTLALSFLEPGQRYGAVIYMDAENADWDKNPTALNILEKEVSSESQLDVELAPGGGVAVSFIPI